MSNESPVAEWLVHRASTPQVRGSNPGMGKVDSAFHPFRSYVGFTANAGYAPDEGVVTERMLGCWNAGADEAVGETVGIQKQAFCVIVDVSA
ncbi:hypothetical protein TNCV_2544051 [Trichonephila clavipes]|nr:hypothetical protein TNCV_2544051 [Trichonephila clavipes]